MNATDLIDATGTESAPELTSVQEAPTATQTFPLEFRGNGAEYFRIWIVNLLLTILTLGVFSAWAKVRRQRYFYGSTWLDGHPFTYHARPVAILKGRLIVFAGYLASFIALQFYPPLLWGVIPLVVVGLPWVLMRSRRFQLRMTSWRNLRFDFRGHYLAAVNAFIGWYLVAALVMLALAFVAPFPKLIAGAVFVLALAYPYWVYERVYYSLENAQYGSALCSFLTGCGRFFAICLATAAISVAAYLLFIIVLVKSSTLKLSPVWRDGEIIDRLIESGPLGWVLILSAVLSGFAIAAMYRAWLLNASFGGVMVHGHRLRSRVGLAGLAAIKVTNLLGMLLTLGLYYPFAKVRQIRYQISCMALEGSGRFDEISAVESPQPHALGEEASDFFDVDLGL